MNIFNGVSSIGDSNLINQLEDNFKTYLDRGLLSIGGFINVDIPTSGLYGGTFHQLQTVETPGYRDGQVWQAPKKDWVWETDITYNDGSQDVSPISISGIYVNNEFIPGPTGNSSRSYTINYPFGQIVFDKPMSRATKVELSYSYKWCQVYKSSTSPYWKELQELSYDPYPDIKVRDKGDYNLSANHRVQPPCIIIEPISRSYNEPWQLGSHTFNVHQDFLFHVFTENGPDNNRITDILRLQQEQTVSLYDINKVVKSGVNPINYDGSINTSGVVYSSLISDYFWNKTYLKNVSILNMESRNKNLYWCTIRLTSETII